MERWPDHADAPRAAWLVAEACRLAGDVPESAVRYHAAAERHWRQPFAPQAALYAADAYLTLANRGVHVDPQVVSEVDDAQGKVIERFASPRRRVLERSQADVVNFVLRQVVERGTGTGAAIDEPVAGKTGTTQDFGDAWFVGYTPKLTAAVWMGYPEGQSRAMVNVHGRRVNGGSFPAAIFKRFMTAATKGTDTGDFPTPSSLRLVPPLVLTSSARLSAPFRYYAVIRLLPSHHRLVLSSSAVTVSPRRPADLPR